MEYLNIFAIIGNVVLLSSGLPEIYTLLKKRVRTGLSAPMIWCWFIGNLAMMIYNIFGIKDIYNSLLFTINLLITTLIIYIYYFKCHEVT